ncbi:MAG: cyclodeaminase/cyclohydrolase family protein [Clostridia bacterium]
MKDLSIAKFAEITASKRAVPGGGSSAALCGGLAGALVEMVANLTVGNKRYAESEEKMKIARDRALILRQALLDGIEKDSNAYSAVMDAYRLPKSGEEEIRLRNTAVQEGLKKAARVPMEIASRAYDVLELSGEVVRHGNKNAKTDGLVSAMMARTAVLGALLNVKTNLELIEDEDFVRVMSQKVEELRSGCILRESEILAGAGFRNHV